MSYSDFTIDDLKQKLGLKLVYDQALLPIPPEQAISDDLKRYLAKYKPLALSIDAPEKIMGILTKMCLGE